MPSRDATDRAGRIVNRQQAVRLDQGELNRGQLSGVQSWFVGRKLQFDIN